MPGGNPAGKRRPEPLHGPHAPRPERPLISTWIGYAGAAIIALAYFLNQSGLLRSDDWRYPTVNLLGSALIMVSLVYAFNAPSVAIELFWSAISVYGLWRSLRRSS